MASDLVLTGMTFSTADFKFGPAARSAGHGVGTGAFPAPGNPFTIEAWAKSTSGSGVQVIASTPAQNYLAVNAGKPTLNNTITSATSIANDGLYHHFVWQDSGTTLSFYLDGVLVGTAASTTSAGTGLPPTSSVKIGAYDASNNGTPSFVFGGSIDEVAIFAGAKYSSNFTPPTAPYSASSPNLLTVYHLDSDGVATNGTGGSILDASNAGWYFSPYTWNVASGKAITVNSGAYFRTVFTGSATCVLNFDVTNNTGTLPEIWWRIDGYGGWTKAALASTITCAISTDMGPTVSHHLLEVVVKANAPSTTPSRWSATSPCQVAFTGVTLASSASLVTPSTRTYRGIFFGDSITEGVFTTGTYHDAMQSWAFELGKAMDSEFGLIGMAGVGLLTTGNGSVPPLPSSYNLLYTGVSRNFTPVPDYAVVHIGTNDGSSNTIAAMTTFLNGLQAVMPGKPIIVLRPFNGTAQASNLQAAIAASTTPQQVLYFDTAGVFNLARGVDASNLHPTGSNNLGFIAPTLANTIRTLFRGYPRRFTVS